MDDICAQSEPISRRLRSRKALSRVGAITFTHSDCLHDFGVTSTVIGSSTEPDVPLAIESAYRGRCEQLHPGSIGPPARDELGVDDASGVYTAEQRATTVSYEISRTISDDGNVVGEMVSDHCKFASLPIEMMQMILDELDPSSVKRLSDTCTLMKRNIACLRGVFVVLDVTDYEDDPLAILAPCNYDCRPGASQPAEWRLNDSLISITLSPEDTLAPFRERKTIALIRVYLCDLPNMLPALHASLLVRRCTKVTYDGWAYRLKIVRACSAEVKKTLDLYCDKLSDEMWQMTMYDSWASQSHRLPQAWLVRLALIIMSETQDSLAVGSSEDRSRILKHWRSSIPRNIGLGLAIPAVISHRYGMRYLTLWEAWQPYSTRWNNNQVLHHLSSYVRPTSRLKMNYDEDGSCNREPDGINLDELVCYLESYRPAGAHIKFDRCDENFEVYFVMRVLSNSFKISRRLRGLCMTVAVRLIEQVLRSLRQCLWRLFHDTTHGSEHIDDAVEQMLLGQSVWLSSQKLVYGDITRVIDLKHEWLEALQMGRVAIQCHGHCDLGHVARLLGYSDKVPGWSDVDEILEWLQCRYRQRIPTHRLVVSGALVDGGTPLEDYCRPMTGFALLRKS